MVIDNIECEFLEHNISNSKDIPVFIWPNFHHQGNEAEHLLECLSNRSIDTPFVVATFFVDDWNADLSPWPAQAVFKDEAFAGQGKKTLDWIEREFIPTIKERYENAESKLEFYIMGYSLAGLFSLWANYERDLFCGCVAASPSVWFPEWDFYVEKKMKAQELVFSDEHQHGMINKKRIYLSIGNKEEKTKNAIMKTVGDRIRWQYKILSESIYYDATYEVNPGGHFADSGERLAKGVAWLIGLI